MGEKPKAAPLDLGLLEEDDEFEEFPAEDWTAKDQDDEDISVWEDNWDDDNVEDDFSKQLKIELSKPLSEDKKKRTNAEMARELRSREAHAEESQQMSDKKKKSMSPISESQEKSKEEHKNSCKVS